MPNIIQVRNVVLKAPAVVAGSSLDADYLLWKAAVGSVGATQETATNALIVSLKANSLWTVHDRIWLYASENSTQALTCLKSLSVSTNNGSTFTASQGYAGNASSTYIDSGFAGSNGVNYTRNSASLSVYIRTNRTSAVDKSAVGFADPVSTGNASRFEPYSLGGVIICPLNANGFDQFANGSGSARGFFTVSRTGSTTTDVYKNSSSTTLSTQSVASTSLISTTFYVGAANDTAAGAVRFSDDQIAIVAFGAGLSGANAAQFQTDINAYMQSLGTHVYT